MRKLIITPVVLAGFVLSAAACGGSKSETNPSAAAMSSSELSERLSGAGIACSTQPSDEPLDKFVVENTQCDVEGEEVNLYTFRDAGARRNWYATIETITCAAFVGFEFYMVEIENTGVIAPETATLAKQIGDALDTSVNTISC